MQERETPANTGDKDKTGNQSKENVLAQNSSDAGQAKPKIGDTRPAPDSKKATQKTSESGNRRRRKRRKGKSANNNPNSLVSGAISDERVELDAETLKKRRGRERKGKAVGRYTMVVHVDEGITQIATLEGRSLIEFFVSRPSDDVSEIHGNIYMGKVENVLPGMEAAFVDIGTPKNAVLYQSDLATGEHGKKNELVRIENVLKNKESVMCQVTKNPIAHKGARLTQEISLAGRFVVLVPNSSTFGISKRLPERERKRLRQILEKAKPAEHGIILRTAAQHITKEEIEQDVNRLLDQWRSIEATASKSKCAGSFRYCRLPPIPPRCRDRAPSDALSVERILPSSAPSLPRRPSAGELRSSGHVYT